ncbi:MAG: cytochrome P450, partial [Acidimicrobiia bacterium]|nr:cytochrome P450 [Acidimicrobiia bacterium]
MYTIRAVPDLSWDPYDEDIERDPYDTWRRLRDEAPVYRNDTHDFYALSRFADVEAAHRDPQTFSSARGTVLEIMGPDLSRTGQMIFLDPPEHTGLRQLVSRAFTPRRVAQVEGRVRDLCAELLDPLVGEQELDYVEDFGDHLPSMVISSLLGLPKEEQRQVRAMVDGIFHIEPGVGIVNETSINAGAAVAQYVAGELEKRRRSPGDDLLTALVQAEITDDEGVVRRMTEQETVEFAMLLFVAGTETVGRLLGWAAVVLADHPEQRKELAEDSSLIPRAVEELLRFEAPSGIQGRWTTRDVELHGTEIPRDSKVLLLTAAAGRDERVFRDADRFDIHRAG